MRSKDLMEEQFASLSEFPNYTISSYGRVVNNVTGREIKPFMSEGFLQVRLVNDTRQRTFTLHRLVAMLFLSGYDRHRRVIFRNDNRRDVGILNLEHAEQRVRTSEIDDY